MSETRVINGVTAKVSGGARFETRDGKTIINLDSPSRSSSGRSSSGGGSATIITPISETGERGSSGIYDTSNPSQPKLVTDVQLPQNATPVSVKRNGSNIEVIYRTREEATAVKGEYTTPSGGMSIAPSIVEERRIESQKGVFFDNSNRGFSQNPSTVPLSIKERGFGFQTITFADNSQKTEYSGKKVVYGTVTDVNPYTPSKSEKFVNTASTIIDYPVTKSQQLFFSQKSPDLKFGSYVSKPKGDINAIGKVGTDIGSYFVPYYGGTRFIKDIGVFGYNVAKNPSYAVNEGKYETLGLIGVAGLYGGSKAYSKFVRNPKISDFGVVKQTSQIKFFETKTSKSNIVKYTETNTGFVAGVDPLARNQILKELKLTSMTERVKGVKTSFDISDKSFGVSRKGTRELFMDLDTGYSKTIDVFDVSRFGKKSSYLKITDSSSQGFSTNVYNLGSKNSKPIMSITGNSPNLSFTVGRLNYNKSLNSESDVYRSIKPFFGVKSSYLKSTDFSSKGFSTNIYNLDSKNSKPLITITGFYPPIKKTSNTKPLFNRKLSSSDSVSSSYSKVVGSENYAFRIDVLQSRKVSQQVKLSKYYSVESKTELGIVLDSKGVSSLRPVSSSKTYKNILKFGEDYSFNANKYLTKDYTVSSYKKPTVLETTYTLEDINLKFTKLPKSESKYLFKANKNNFLSKSNIFTSNKNRFEINNLYLKGNNFYSKPELVNKEYEKILSAYREKKISGKENDLLRGALGLFGEEEQKLSREILIKNKSLFKNDKNTFKSLKFTKLPKSESKFNFKKQNKYYVDQGIQPNPKLVKIDYLLDKYELEVQKLRTKKNSLTSLLKSKKGSLMLSTPELKFKTQQIKEINEYNFISVPKKSVSSSLSYVNLESSIVPTSKISSSFTPISFSSFNYRNDISPKSEISTKLQYSLRSSSNSDISLKNEYKSIVSPKLKVDPIVKSKSITKNYLSIQSKPSFISIPKSKSSSKLSSFNISSLNLNSSSKSRSDYKTKSNYATIQKTDYLQLQETKQVQKQKQITLKNVSVYKMYSVPRPKTPNKLFGFPFMFPKDKSKSFNTSKKLTFKSTKFNWVNPSYTPLASLSEVFKYEAETGKEAGYVRSKKAKRIFENQLFGKGNFNSIIKYRG